MPSYDAYHVFISEDRSGSRPKCVFNQEILAKQAYRRYDFPDLSARDLGEDIEELRVVAADARADFERELERRVLDAERRGQEVALQESAQVHAEERAKLVERMEGAIEAFHLALDRAEATTARDAVRLGLMVAERLTRTVLSQSPDALVATLADGVDKMEGEGSVKIVAPPDLAAQLHARTAEILGELGLAGVEVESDDTLKPGDLMIYRGSTALDARVATRVRKIERSLLAELGFDGAEED